MNEECDGWNCESVPSIYPNQCSGCCSVPFLPLSPSFSYYFCLIPSLLWLLFLLPSTPQCLYKDNTDTNPALVELGGQWKEQAAWFSHDGRLRAAREKHTQERISVSLLWQLCMCSQKLRPMTELFCCYLLEDRFLSIWFLKAICIEALLEISILSSFSCRQRIDRKFFLTSANDGLWKLISHMYLLGLDENCWLNCDKPEKKTLIFFKYSWIKIYILSTIFRRGIGKGRANFCAIKESS